MNRSRTPRTIAMAVLLLVGTAACSSGTDRSAPGTTAPGNTAAGASTATTPGSGSSTTTAGTTGTTGSTEPGLPAVDTTSSDALISVLGFPDAFRAETQVVDGNQVIIQSFVYADLAQRFDLVGGVVIGTEAIEPLPDDTLLPLQYSIYDVWLGMTRTEVTDALPDVEFTPIDASSFTVQGGTVLAGGQIVIGLLDDVVVYVETFPLVPDPNGEYEALFQEATS